MNSRQFIYLLFFFELIASGFWYTGGAVTAMFLIAAAVAGCHIVFTRQSCQVYALSKLMLVYLFWLFVVAWLSAVPETAMMTLAALAGMPVMYLFATNAPTFNEIWKFLRIALFLLGVVLALWAIWQVFYHIGYGYAQGPLDDRNLFAALMNLLWFPATYIFLSAQYSRYHFKLSATGFGLFVMSTALFATTSRAGIVTWLLLMPVFLWAAYYHRQFGKRIAILLLITVSAYLCSDLFLNVTIADRTFELSQDTSANARLLLWQSSIQMIMAHPVFGSGWGTFIHYYPAYRVPLENSSAGIFAHNDYLQLAVEGGVLALLLQISILSGLLIQLRLSMKRLADVAAFESVTLLLGVLALFIHAVLNFIFYLAIMNILAGVYLARAAQLTDKANTVQVFNVNKINALFKYLVAGILVLVISMPYGLRLLEIPINNVNKVKIENLVSDDFTVYKLAELITKIQPQQYLAQEAILLTAELALGDEAFIRKMGEDFYRRLLEQTIRRFDSVRALNANDAGVGIREARMLIRHHAAFDDNYAYTKARKVLNDNLLANPYHVDSIIELSRLQRMEGRAAEALHTMQHAKTYVLKRRDKQLIYIELLRQLAAPETVPELDILEKELRKLRFYSETGIPLILPANYFEEVDAKLDAIAYQIQSNAQ